MRHTTALACVVAAVASAGDPAAAQISHLGQHISDHVVLRDGAVSGRAEPDCPSTASFNNKALFRVWPVALHGDRITNRARASRASSIFFRRIVGVVFMRVNWKCAHQVQPPSRDRWGFSRPSVDSWTPYAARAHRVEMGGRAITS